jgi:hypothetical protein
MVNLDPIDHYCSYLQRIMEGGASLSNKGKVVGHTSDMAGRWTIKAFDTDKANKKETPPMKEAVYANNAGVMEVFKFFKVASDEQKNEFDRLLNSGNERGAWGLVQKVLGVELQGDGPWKEGYDKSSNRKPN